MLKAIERAQHLSLTQASYEHRHGIRSAEHRKDQRLFMISNSPMAPRAYSSRTRSVFELLSMR